MKGHRLERKKIGRACPNERMYSVHMYMDMFASARIYVRVNAVRVPVRASVRVRAQCLLGRA